MLSPNFCLFTFYLPEARGALIELALEVLRRAGSKLIRAASPHEVHRSQRPHRQAHLIR